MSIVLHPARHGHGGKPRGIKGGKHHLLHTRIVPKSNAYLFSLAKSHAHGGGQHKTSHSSSKPPPAPLWYERGILWATGHHGVAIPIAFDGASAFRDFVENDLAGSVQSSSNWHGQYAHDFKVGWCQPASDYCMFVVGTLHTAKHAKGFVAQNPAIGEDFQKALATPIISASQAHGIKADSDGGIVHVNPALLTITWFHPDWKIGIPTCLFNYTG